MSLGLDVGCVIIFPVLAHLVQVVSSCHVNMLCRVCMYYSVDLVLVQMQPVKIRCERYETSHLRVPILSDGLHCRHVHVLKTERMLRIVLLAPFLSLEQSDYSSSPRSPPMVSQSCSWFLVGQIGLIGICNI